MTTFSHAQLEFLWMQAGGDEFAADTAAAIAQAESSGCQYAKAGPIDDRPVKQCRFNYTTGENSYGLWQINRVAHPQYSPSSLYTADGNARAAIGVSNNGKHFYPWTTWRNDAYKQFLTGPLPPSVPRPPPTDVGATAAGEHLLAGWHEFSLSLSNRLPRALTRSQQLRNATLRKLR